jgi:hypothetical protein
MLQRWLAPVLAQTDGERALAAVREVARHHRIQASPGYDAAVAWLTGALSEGGISYAIERVPADGRTALLGCVMPEGWSCEHASAALVAPGTASRPQAADRSTPREPLADFAAEPLSLVQRSTPAAGRYPLVALPGDADGSRAEHYAGVDVRGRVVLTEGPVQRVHALAVLERGAAGLLSYGRRLVPPARTRETDRDSLAYTSFWWGGDEPRGWGFVASPNRGAALARRLATGEAIELEADIRTRRYATTIPLVTATIPGTLPGEVLLTSHLCHPHPGANDNGSGVAATLEAMRVLATLARNGELPARRRTIRTLWMPEFTGTYGWLAGDPGRAAHTLAALNLDMVGEDQAACASEQLLERSPHFTGSFADELVRQVRHATRGADAGDAWRARETPYSGGSDHALWLDPGIGVPCPMLIQWPDRFYHSSYDTPERCDPRSLAHAARIGVVYAAFLAGAGEAERTWLAGQLERAAVREMRLALDAAEPEAAARAARLRGQRALASLSRFGEDGGLEATLAAGAEILEGAFESEVLPRLPGAGHARASRADDRIPFRRQRTLLAPMRSLQAGWLELPAASRERWNELDRDAAGGSTALDLAWFACDGRRTLDEILGALADEGVETRRETLESFFALAVELGTAGWRTDG